MYQDTRKLQCPSLELDLESAPTMFCLWDRRGINCKCAAGERRKLSSNYCGSIWSRMVTTSAETPWRLSPLRRTTTIDREVPIISKVTSLIFEH